MSSPKTIRVPPATVVPSTKRSELPHMGFVSLGEFNVDTYHLPNGQVIKNVVSGSGAFGALGARLFALKGKYKQIGYYMLGSEMHSRWVMEQVESWNIILVRHEDFAGGCSQNRLTRSDSGGQENSDGQKSPVYDMFGESTSEPADEGRYPGVPLSASALAHRNNRAFLHSSGLHITHGHGALPEIVTRFWKLRENDSNRRKPVILWEPPSVPCKTSALQGFRDAAFYADVLFLSNKDLATVSGLSSSSSIAMAKEEIEGLAWRFIKDTKRMACIVVNSPTHGYVMCSRDETVRWFSHYQKPDLIESVDCAGTSSAFVGAFGMSYMHTGSFLKACAAGVVATSFVLEQSGLPRLGKRASDGRETWNGFYIWDRLTGYIQHMGLASVQRPPKQTGQWKKEESRNPKQNEGEAGTAAEEARRMGMEVGEAQRLRFTEIPRGLKASHQG